LLNSLRLSTGGRRYAATTGYYLTALQPGPTRYQRVGDSQEIPALPNLLRCYQIQLQTQIRP
jgi:hypothetical protein